VFTDGNSKIFGGIDFLEHVSVDGIPSVDRFTLVGNSYNKSKKYKDGQPEL
jgi:hypothetical protein